MPENEKAPSNSFVRTSLDRTKPPTPPAPQKITTGKVKTHRKSIGQKLLDYMIPKDLNAMADYIMDQVVFPKIQDIVLTTLTSFFGGDKSQRPNQSSSRGKYVSFMPTSQPQRSSPMPTQRNMVDNIIFETAEDAHNVLASLREYLSMYPQVTVGYLYGLMGYESDHAKENYGWYSLDGAGVVSTREGYLLQLPNPVWLNR